MTNEAKTTNGASPNGAAKPNGAPQLPEGMTPEQAAQIADKMNANAFPLQFNVGGAELKLHADGTWSGDGDRFLSELHNLKNGGMDPIVHMTLWSVARAIRAGLDRK